MLTVIGHMYNVHGQNIILSQKLTHPVAVFLTKQQFDKETSIGWNKALVHEAIRDLSDKLIDLYYIKTNIK